MKASRMLRSPRPGSLLALLLVLAACGSTPEFGAADTGSEIEVDTGDRFTVSLESNRTTGYEWVLAGFEELDGVLTMTDETFIEPDTDLVGAAGTQVFTFEAVGTGAGVLRLEYIRPFDNPPVADQVVEYIVRVDGAEWPPPSGATPSTSTQGA